MQEEQEPLLPKREQILAFYQNRLKGTSPDSSDPITQEVWRKITEDPLGATVVEEAIKRYEQAPKKRKSEAADQLVGALRGIYIALWQNHPPQDLTSPPPPTSPQP